MDCWTCEKSALAACRFCGRGVCREHAKTMPFVLEVIRGRPPDDGAKALVVDDAVHCGVCHPRGEPVPLPELDAPVKHEPKGSEC